MHTGTASRREAIFILTRWMETEDFPDRLLTDSPDRGFVMDLVYGTVRWRRALEWALGQLMKRPAEGETHAALLIGAYQVLLREEMPAYATVHATVEAAKIASARSAGLVNGVLRNLLRRRDELLASLAKQPVGVRLSHPDALVARWQARYGATETEALCQWNNVPAQTVIALLPDFSSATVSPSNRLTAHCSLITDYCSLLTTHYSQLTGDSPPLLTPHPAAPERCLLVPHGMRVEDLPGYREGRFVVQDPATLAAVDLLDVRPGMTVLDACAAPGGKTAQLAARMAGQGRLIAMDLYADRLQILQSTLDRTRQNWVEVVQGDATVNAPLDPPKFDRILLDVPCSNTGVLRRRPDARWRFSVQRLKQLCAVQQQILTRMLPRLAPGGRLVYSTCSLEPEENREQVQRALAATPDMRLEAVEERLPMRNGIDGAFAAVLVRE